MKKKEVVLPGFVKAFGPVEIIRMADCENSALCRVIKPMKVWKKVCKNAFGIAATYRVISLTLPRGAIFWCHRDSLSRNEDPGENSKCRANKAVSGGTGFSMYIAQVSGGKSFEYKVGKKLAPRRAFNKSAAICASGIHFFRRRVHAINYNL